MEKKKIEWEKPKLVEIGKSQVITHGDVTFDCGPGNSAANSCKSGNYFD